MEAATSSTCQLTTGVFLRRACDNPATARCGRCARAVCEEHIRRKTSAGATLAICVDCLSQARSSGPVFVSSSTDFDRSSSSSGGATAASDPDFAGGGGSFGGAGASGGWDPADATAGAAPAGTTDPAGATPDFSPADFAAFDAMTDADKDQGSPGYDS
jgi:hypothetical protein